MTRLSFVFGVLLGLSVSAALLQCLFLKRQHEANTLRSRVEGSGFELGESLFSAPRPALGWWVHAPAQGVWWPAVRVDETSLYPGYDSFQADSALWSKLKGLRVDSSLRVGDADEAYLLMSSEACLPIVESQGVDLLLLGNCEGYRATRMRTWAEVFPDRKLLPCFRNESDTDFVRSIARGLMEYPKSLRPRHVVWFLSPWQLLSEVSSSDAAFSPFHSDRAWWTATLRNWRRSIAWPNYRAFSEVELSAPHSVDYFRRSLATRRSSRHVSASEMPGCETPILRRSMESIGEVLTVFQRSGIRVTIAIPSYLPMGTSDTWPCVVEKMRLAWESQHSVFVLPENLVTAGDFAFPVHGRSTLNPHHLNARGARVYSDELAHRVSKLAPEVGGPGSRR